MKKLSFIRVAQEPIWLLSILAMKEITDMERGEHAEGDHGDGHGGGHGEANSFVLRSGL